MALFNWFHKTSADNRKKVSRGSAQLTQQNQNVAAFAAALPPSPRSATDAVNRSEERKAKRHARREQLYSAIRQAMTRAGVLSASFKFKVLSLDQRGDQFLVMMDLQPHLGLAENVLAESETLIVQTAKNQFDILVTSVYWRVDPHVAGGGPRPVGAEPKPDTTLSTPELLSSVKKPTASRYEPIDDAEVAEFKRSISMSAASAPESVSSATKGRSGLRSYTLITGFEDTEMPESSAGPALSATQYGELN